MLVGAPLAGAAHAGLDFVEEQESAGGVAQFARGLQELGRDGVDAAFALQDFDADAADVVGERSCAERRHRCAG